MKYLILFVWISFAGLLLGSAIDSKADRCGGSVKVEIDDVFSALTWPVLVFATITLSEGNVASSECEQ